MKVSAVFLLVSIISGLMLIEVSGASVTDDDYDSFDDGPSTYGTSRRPFWFTTVSSKPFINVKSQSTPHPAAPRDPVVLEPAEPPTTTASASVNWRGNNWAFACDFPHNDLASVQIPGDQCGGRCATTERCTHFVHTKYNQGTCWMKFGPVTQQDVVFNNDYTTTCGVVVKDEPVTSTTGPQKIVELRGWKADGSSAMGLADGSDSANCLSHCRANSNCRFVSYNRRTRACDGFNDSVTPVPTQDTSYSLLAASVKRFRASPGMDYPGDDLFPSAIGTTQPDVCLSLCYIYPQCNVVIHSPPYRGCWLKAKATLNPLVIREAYNERDFPGIFGAVTHISEDF